MVTLVESSKDVSALGILLLCLGEILGVLDIGDVLDFKRHIMLEPRGVFLYSLAKIASCHLAHNCQNDFHS